MSAPNLRNAAIGAGLLAGALSLGANAQGQEQDMQVAANFQNASLSSSTGHPVTFQYGPGVNANEVDGYVQIVSEHGCPATATADGLPFRVNVKTNGNSYLFKDPGSAAGWAIDNCNG